MQREMQRGIQQEMQLEMQQVMQQKIQQAMQQVFQALIEDLRSVKARCYRPQTDLSLGQVVGLPVGVRSQTSHRARL
jgi:vacuolar-type H+-ATPase subunit E/Vma4